ncbi:MAG: uroporphyrinogen decarboxylase/cobalamine-independent methonine synthase family protein [Cuniculiplasma sp.]
MRIETLIYGIYPRSDRLRLEYGRLERGVETTEKIKDIIREEKSNFYQMTKGINFVTDPLFNWYDVFRSISLSVDGISLGPLRRYLETNTFYREPEITRLGELKLDVLEPLEFEDNPPFPMFQNDHRGVLPIFPEPSSMYSMSSVSPEVGEKEFSLKLLKIYDRIAEQFNSGQIVIFSPKATYQNMEIYKELNSSRQLFLVLNESVKEGSFENLSFKFESIIVPDKKYLDLAQNNSIKPGLQMLDSHNTRIETVEELKKELLTIENATGIKNLIVTHRDYMDFLPRTIADRKVKILKEMN